MTRLLVLLMFPALLLVACKPQSAFDITDKMLNNVPDSVLAADTMVNIMADIHLAEAWASENKTDSLNQDEQLEAYYTQIFKIHNITSAAYKSSYRYYSNKPVLMNYIYQQITAHLSLMESENLNNLKKK